VSGVRLFRAASLRAADAAAAAAGVATTDLMERAGEAVAAAVLRHWPDAQRVAILCGPGNNGGDGFVAARHLARAGRDVRLAELKPGVRRGDAAWAHAGLEASGFAFTWLTSADETPPDDLPLGGVDLVVDALFGTGLTRPLEGRAAAWVAAVAASGLPVLAVDVPSGVDADRAAPPGACIRATRTLQLAGAVPASLLAPARSAFGRTEVVDIGIPSAILDQHTDARAVDDAWLASHAPRRSDDTHKYRAGTVLVVGGSRRYAGAPELSARAAYRSGAGLVTLVSDERAPDGWPEVVWEPPRSTEGVPAAALRIVTAPGGERRAGVAVIGPGLEADAADVATVIAAVQGPVVLDAGALLPGLREAARAHGGAVLTPHAGEAQRLLDALAGTPRDASDAMAAERDPIAAAVRLAGAWGAVCVLKGPGTVIAAPDGRWTISAAGTSALATAGSGDVLAGVIAAFLAAAPKADAWRCSAAAAHLHGVAGVIAAERGPGTIASDVVLALPEALRRHGRVLGCRP